MRLVHDDAHVPPAGPDARSDLVETVVELAGRHVAAGQVAGAGLAGFPARHPAPGRKPVTPPAVITEYLGESQGLEPPRGPRAQVSPEVMAVHDHRPPPLEPGGTRPAKGREREVDGSGDVRLGVLVTGQHVHELGALRDESLHLIAIDRGRHLLPSF
jgi:hypothetical protein